MVPFQVLPPRGADGHLVEVAELKEELDRSVAAARHRRVVSDAPILALGVWTDGTTTIRHQVANVMAPLASRRQVFNRAMLTFKGVSAVVELQLENVVRCSVGVQSRQSWLASADETVLAAKDDDGTVDELHQELLRLP